MSRPGRAWAHAARCRGAPPTATRKSTERSMLQVSLARLKQGHRTILSPAQQPVLPDRFRGLPVIDSSKCPDDCRDCADACPTNAIEVQRSGVRLDLGRCLFCTDCTEACPEGSVRYTQEYRLATR